MYKLSVYSIKGVKKGTINLPKAVEERSNLPLLAQAMRVYEDRQHPGLSRVKTRAEVRISKRKIYRQKGTGGAIHGAKSAPIFVGGGVAHGPKGVKKILRLPQQMKRKAMLVGLTSKAKENHLVVVSGVSGIQKTKEAYALINKINDGEEIITAKCTFIISEKNNLIYRYLRNIKNLNVVSSKDLNSYLTTNAKVTLIDEDALSEIGGNQSVNAEKKETKPETKKVLKIAKTTKSKIVKKSMTRSNT